MSLVASVRTFLLTFSGLSAEASFLVDSLSGVPTQYGLFPLPSARIIEEYLNGSSQRQFTFALQSMESTADDMARMQASGFYETFADWLESQTEAGALPALDAGKTAESIEALQHGFLFEYGESGIGIYQIQCRLIYRQDAP